MYKNGTLKVGGIRYKIYVIDTPSMFRLDIHDYTSESMYNPDKVIYSIIETKDMRKHLGNYAIYKSYTKARQRVFDFEGEMEFEPPVIDGMKIIEKVKKKFPDNRTLSFTKVNTEIVSEEWTSGLVQATLTISNQGEYFPLPKNIKKYEDLDLKEVKSERYTSLDQIRITKDIEHLKDWDLGCCETEEEVWEYLSQIKDKKSWIGFDTETTGLEVDKYGSDRIVCLVVGISETSSRLIPFRFEEESGIKNLPLSFMGEVLDYLKDYELLCGFNAKFDMKAVWQDKYYDFKLHHDGLIGLRLNNTDRIGGNGLKEVTMMIRSVDFIEFEDLGNNINFAKVPKELAILYACPDACNHIAATKYALEKLPASIFEVYNLECLLQPIVANSEYWGYNIDMDLQEKKYLSDSLRRDVLVSYLNEVAGQQVNINSSMNMINLLFQRLKYKIIKRGSDGEPSVDSETLTYLRKQKLEKSSDIFTSDVLDPNGGKPLLKKDDLNMMRYPFAIFVEAARGFDKLISSFHKKIITKSNEGRYYVKTDQLGAGTGRQSSHIHQLPKETKEVIIADSSEHNLVGADFSQIELRIVYGFSGIKSLIEASEDPTIDLHRLAASFISGIPIHEITPEMRQAYKSVNFGIVYGKGVRTLAVDLHGHDYTKEQYEEVKRTFNSFFSIFDAIRDLIDETVATVRKCGFAETLYGRVRKLPRFLEPNLSNKEESALSKKAFNTKIQGTAADVMKIVEINVANFIAAKGWDKIIEVDGVEVPFCRIMLSAHDELLASYHNSIPVEEILEMIVESMNIHIKELGITLVASPCLVNNWYQSKDDANSVPVDVCRDLIAEYKRTGKSRFSTNCKHKDEVLEFLDEYRRTELEEYMNSLMEENGTDPKVLAQALTHPHLTHELIALYNNKGLKTQIEKKEYAITQYLNKSEGDTRPKEQEQVSLPVTIEMSEILKFSKVEELIDLETVTKEQEQTLMDSMDSNLELDEELEEEEPITTRCYFFKDVIILDFKNVSLGQKIKALKEIKTLSETLIGRKTFTVKIAEGDKLTDAGLSLPKSKEILDQVNLIILGG